MLSNNFCLKNCKGVGKDYLFNIKLLKRLGVVMYGYFGWYAMTNDEKRSFYERYMRWYIEGVYDVKKS